MKNKIQSYVGMRLGGRRLIDTLTTHLSPTNHPLKHGIGKYIFSFLLVLTMSVGQMWAADYLINVESGNLSSDSKWYEVASVGGVTNKTGSTWSSADYSCTPVGAKIGSSNFTVRTDLANTTQITVVASSGSNRTISGVKTGSSLSSLTTATGCTSSGSVTKNNCGQVLTFTFSPALSAGTYVNIAMSGNMNVHSVTITATAATTYAVTYSAGDGSVKAGKSLPTQAAVAAGTEITLASADDLEKDGKEFDGWLCSINSTKYAAGAKYTMTAEATTFTAQWRDPAPAVCPSGLTISGTAAYTEGETISLTAALEAGNGEITYTWYKGSIAAGNEVGTGASFSKASCATSDAGNYFCVASKDACSDAESSAYAVTVDALVACAELYPATSGASPTAANQEIILQTEAPNASFGGKIYTHSAKSGDFAASFKYTANGIQLNKGGDDKMRVELTHLMQVGTTITVTLVNPDASKARGFKLCNASGTAKATWQETTTDPYQKTYTVVAGDGLAGSNIFILQRAESSALKELKVSNCGAELLALSSAVTPAHDPAYATVTLSKNLVEAGGSATATYSIADPTAYDFDGWEITTGDATIADPTAATAAITMGTTASTITLKLKTAEVKHTVTYYDGETELGTELVVEGENPTASEIVAPHKLGYSFAGWSTTNGGDATALSGITVSADMPLYAVYNAVNCNALSGKIFEVNINVAPAANCTIRSGSGYETSADLIKYGTVSGGIAIAENSSTSNHLIITTTPTVKFAGGNGDVHISFDCALKVGDKIKTTISSQNIAYTTTNTRNTTNYFNKGTDQELTITSGHALENATEIYLWAASSNGGELNSLQVIRPEKFEVTFNMHDHGDAVDPQYVIDGGKVTEPATTDISGWDFGGWYKTYVAEPESYSDAWDFENDVVSAATELHAKWTEHVKSSDATLSSLTVNGQAITLEDGVFAYAVELPMGTTALPTIVAVANDPNSKGVSVLQTNIGSATITVTAEDDSFKDYMITFTVADSKDIELVWDKSKKRCDDTTPTANVKSDDASVSVYINKITFTGGGAEGSSLNVGNTAGNMFTLSAKAGYAFQALSFFGKIQDATCEYSLNGGAWTELASTKTDGDKCYSDVFSAAEVHEFRLRSTGTSGVWIRNMQLTMIEACTPIVVAWDEEPVEFEVGKSGYTIAATANNGGTVSYSSESAAVVDVVAATGALTISGLGSATLKAATAEGDGTTYCANGGNDIEISKAVNTYYLVKFDAQNGDAADEVKYYSGDAAIALPAAPSYPGYDFQGWFDAETGGNQYTEAITPAASMTVYAQWVAQCAGATITTQPTGASYLTGRTATALVCEATAGNGGELTYEWFTCDDEYKANPVAATATPSTAVAGTFYYFCKVTEEGCAVEAFSDVVTITVADKTPICLIATTVTGATAHGDVTGLYGEDKGGSADVNVTGSSYKMDKGKYIGVTLPDGYKFQEGDKVVLNVKTVNNATGFTLFDGKGGEKNLIIDTRDGNLVPAGANTVVLPAYAGSQSVYVLRENNDATGDLNSAIDAIAVYRTCAPILNKITVNGVEGAPVANVVTIEVPASTTQSQLEAITYDWISNNDAWTAAHTPVATNAWEFGVANTVTLTDKDGDASVYTITVNKAVPSSDATLSALSASAGVLTPAFDPAVLSYAVALPYGTEEVPTLSATKNHVGAADPDIDNAAAFVNLKAVSTVTVMAEDGLTELTYTVTFNVERFPSTVIWDGSTMSAVAESPASGFTWAVTGFSAIANYDATCGTKAYTKCLPSGGSASASRNFALTVPEGYLAKFYIVFGTHSDGDERGMFIGTTATKTLDESSVLTLYSSSRTNLTAGISELVLGEGTWYINPMVSVDFYEISATLIPVGYQRTVTEGRYGTICLPKAGVMVGAELFEVAYYGATSQKVFLDNILSGEMEAGVPYIFLPREGVSQLAVYYTDEADKSAKTANGLIGFIGASADEYFYIPAGEGNYILQNNLYREVLAGAQARILSNRAYIKLSAINLSEPALAPGRRRVSMSVLSEQVTTGMENTGFESEAPRKVLINGELFIIRGEKMFDAKGQLVK